jgi:hypothetical protein
MGGEPTNGILQYSTDYGNTWANLSNFFLSLGIFPICISNDATKMFIGTNNLAYLSTNGGTTWTASNSSGQISAAWANACSLTGAEMISWSKNNGLYLSLNTGTTWSAGASFSIANSYATSVSKDGSVFFMVPFLGSGAIGATSLLYVTRTSLQSSITSGWSSVSIGTNLDFSLGWNNLASSLTGSIVYTGAAYTGAVSVTPKSKISKITGLPGAATVTTIIFDSTLDGSNNYCHNIECSSDGNTVVLVGGPTGNKSAFYYLSLNAGSTWTRYTLPTNSASTVMNCTCSPDGKNVYISGNFNANQKYGSYLIRIGYQGLNATFTTTLYTQSGLATTRSYTVTLTGNKTGGGTTTLYSGSVTTL